MQTFLKKRVLLMFWICLFLHCLFVFLELPYYMVTKLFLVPLLLTSLFVKDENIGSPNGKFVFYIGLMMSFIGDILFMVSNPTFFLAAVIVYMFVNICYSYSFLSLNKFKTQPIILLIIEIFLVSLLCFYIFKIVESYIGNARLPIIVYLIVLGLTTVSTLNLFTTQSFKLIARNYLISGMLLFIFSNILEALNHFKYGRDKYVTIVMIIAYGSAQFLIVAGMKKAYRINLNNGKV